MVNTPKKGVFCMKWDADGELSTHDTDALIKRLANVEKSRRTMLDHHELRRWRSQMNDDFPTCQTLAS
ncbi:hypothetical protein OAK87_02035 [bacterium]|nr:hypothetical protein [bacterium]